MNKAAFLIIALGLAVPALAGGEAEQKQAKPKKEPKICKMIRTTQSRMDARVCKTAAQWEAQSSGKTLDDVKGSIDAR